MFTKNMKNKKVTLKKFFIAWFAVMLVLVIIYFPEDRGIVISEPDFHVTESQEIYFKNIRQSHYVKQTDEQAGFDLYTIRSAEKDSSVSTFTFTIVNNWRADEAFIRMMPMPALFEQDPEKMILLCSEYGSDQKDTLHLLGRSSYDHYLFAAQLYMKIIDDYTFEVVNEVGETMPVLARGEHRLSVKKTLKDYFKLTGKIR